MTRKQESAVKRIEAAGFSVLPNQWRALNGNLAVEAVSNRFNTDRRKLVITPAGVVQGRGPVDQFNQ